MIQRFTKRPVTIDAVRWDGRNREGMGAFCPSAVFSDNAQHSSFLIPTLEGMMMADAGDWIIKGIKGEFYPIKPDIFEETYEPEFVPSVGVSPYMIEAAQIEVFEDAAERIKDLPTS